MTRRVVTRGRKDAAGHRSKTSRAATRTGKKTASARALRPAAPVAVPLPATPKPVTLTPHSRKPAPARTRGAGTPDVMTRLDKDAELEREARLDAARKDTAARTEDDEDLDWLNDEEDPRKQIVEDDEDGDPLHHEEW